MDYLTECTSVNRLTETPEIKTLVDQVYIDVKQLTGLHVHQYFDYYIEETIAKIDPEDLKTKLPSYLEYLNGFDNDKTHMNILWAVQHSFTAFAIINEEIRTVCQSLVKRYNVLREMAYEIRDAENKVKELNYFQNNWEALTTNDPAEFVRILRITEDHHLIYEKFKRLKVADNIVNEFFGVKKKIEDTPEVNELIDSITPFAIATAEVNAGMAMTTLLSIRQFESIPKGKELCDRVYAMKMDQLKKVK